MATPTNNAPRYQTIKWICVSCGPADMIVLATMPLLKMVCRRCGGEYVFSAAGETRRNVPL